MIQDAEDPLISRRSSVGNFRLTKLLGTGGMGSVYLGEHLEVGKKVAIKVLRPDLALDRDSTARFLSEARVVIKLKHPSIVDVYDGGTLPGIGHFLTMEYLEGYDLQTHFKKRGA